MANMAGRKQYDGQRDMLVVMMNDSDDNKRGYTPRTHLFSGKVILPRLRLLLSHAHILLRARCSTRRLISKRKTSKMAWRKTHKRICASAHQASGEKSTA